MFRVLHRQLNYIVASCPRYFVTTCERSKMKIGTHDGVFHCDEALACYLLLQLPEYNGAEIIRTRQSEKLNQCDIVVDVGAVFDQNKKRYDHHQREFNETLSSLRPELGNKYNINMAIVLMAHLVFGRFHHPWTPDTPEEYSLALYRDEITLNAVIIGDRSRLSSAGLVYTFYGEQIIKQLAPKDKQLHSSDLMIIYKKVYENLIQEIDAIDNGVPMTSEEPKYAINTHLSRRVGRLNPEWNCKQELDIDEVFKTAMKLVGEEFLITVNHLMSVWLPARDYVRLAIEERFQVDKSGQILVFKERFPWKEHLFDIEEEMGISEEIKYVIFNDKPDSWRVQAVPIKPNSFVLRKPLNKKWWGVRDDTLSDVASIENCIFCHSNGFIGGNKTIDGALKMAIASLEAENI